MSFSATKRAPSRGFTLSELLAVIAIIAITAAILFPVFAQARSKGRPAVCLSNQKPMGLAIGHVASGGLKRQGKQLLDKFRLFGILFAAQPVHEKTAAFLRQNISDNLRA